MYTSKYLDYFGPYFVCMTLTLSQTTNFRLPNQKEYVDENSKFDENGRKFFRRVENTVGKGKLLIMSNFSFSYSVFKRLLLQTCKKKGLYGKGLRSVFSKSGQKKKIPIYRRPTIPVFSRDPTIFIEFAKKKILQPTSDPSFRTGPSRVLVQVALRI